jgi:hypothetical protein
MMRKQFGRMISWSAAVLCLAAAGVHAQETTDPGWPREIHTQDARIVVYQPQPDSLHGNTLWGRTALSMTPEGKSEPLFGAAWFEARLETDRDIRTATVREMHILRVRFPHSKPEMEQQMSEILAAETPKWDIKLSMDRLLATLDLVAQEQEIASGFNDAPPRFLWEEDPAILLSYDGTPRPMPVRDWRLERVVNTPFLVVRDPSAANFYLQGGDHWFAAPTATGPWASVASVPTEVAAYAAQQERNAAADSLAALGFQDDRIPKIVVATKPSELIVTDGPPEWTPLVGDALLYVSNTESDVFRDIDSENYYVLVAGRWFRSPSIEKGPWTFTPGDSLPEAFAQIAAKSSKGDVLVSVAGTKQAEDALLDAQIPQTAAIERDAAKLEVDYDGTPRFQSIPGAGIEYATNTSTSVLRISGRYYACDQGVWFVSESPNGPWRVADSVPDAVQLIPPDCPVYNVKYVHVYEATPTVVYVGYTPGYTWCYPYNGCVVYGTGWYYDPWWGAVYYPRPVTWGWNAHYSPWTGWGFGMSWGAGWGLWNVNWIDWDGWGGWDGWWGPCGYAPWRPSYVWGYRPPPPGWRYRPYPETVHRQPHPMGRQRQGATMPPAPAAAQRLQHGRQPAAQRTADARTASRAGAGAQPAQRRVHGS